MTSLNTWNRSLPDQLCDTHNLRQMQANRSAHTDPQQQEAASPQVLWSGGLRR